MVPQSARIVDHANEASVAVEASDIQEEPTPGVHSETLNQAVGHVAKSISRLSVNIADTSGIVGDVAADLKRQAEAFHMLADSFGEIVQTNETITEHTHDAASAATRVSQGLETTTGAVEQIFTVATDDIRAMTKSANEVTTGFNEVVSELSQVYGFSESIQKIASETQMLAINASIMAAHAGDAGKGFGVVAESVRQLAQQTANVSKDIIDRLDQLNATVETLMARSRSSGEVAEAASERTELMDVELQKFRSFGADVDALTGQISAISAPVEHVGKKCTSAQTRITVLDDEARRNAEALTNTSEKFNNLVSFSEEMILLVEESGIETEDSALIRACVATASKIAHHFESAVENKEIQMDALFDEAYVPIDNTDPQQVSTRFLAFTDKHLPKFQEAFLSVDPRVVFCAAVDRNGYLPTHNRIYSQPQSADPVWNAANCRNRRIFDDRTGASAGRNKKPFLLQTYRRDMGGGQYTLMKDLSAPIFINGRHWGGLRVGFKV